MKKLRDLSKQKDYLLFLASLSRFLTLILTLYLLLNNIFILVLLLQSMAKGLDDVIQLTSLLQTLFPC